MKLLAVYGTVLKLTVLKDEVRKAELSIINPMNIYLDIDGVLSTRYHQPANHVHEFLKFVTERYPDTTYWLTTHCKGNAAATLEQIGYLFDAPTQELMKKIKATDWDVSKTEAIDFATPFLWFDDQCLDFEKSILKQHGALDNWIKVDLIKNENQLLDFIHHFPLPVDSHE